MRKGNENDSYEFQEFYKYKFSNERKLREEENAHEKLSLFLNFVEIFLNKDFLNKDFLDKSFDFFRIYICDVFRIYFSTRTSTFFFVIGICYEQAYKLDKIFVLLRKFAC